MHDTMGILYQTQSRCSLTEPSPQSGREDEDKPEEDISLPKMESKKRRRKLDVLDKDLPPYRKKPRMNDFSYDNKDFRGNMDLSVPSRKLDFLWMMLHALEMEGIPMWTGFSGQTDIDHLP